ncbi:GNAT family N-acetyltransferase [Flagellimonas hymeniacidonis]|uniref:GNAT family N-acetyltransferase n=1 Tax=Flagellimonas hymeniacidonis TaxID=2603628 RepID=A0A5C8V7G3_9FLAO|nr:GNAT family N-acetyltransferase [Flagellimonas hymeniacidonis]TXN37642.1 GNAT family N-acetyltransferase [Flagellimonas hymeniacidonis]
MKTKEGVQVLRLNENKLELLIKLVNLFNEVFSEYYTVASKKHLKRLLQKPEFYAIVAVKNDAIIGGFTAYEFQKYYTDKSELYIYDIAVKKAFQNQSVGKKLINYLKNNSPGVETIFVDAHSEDIQAVKFYESVFGPSEKVDHYTFDIINPKNS